MKPARGTPRKQAKARGRKAVTVIDPTERFLVGAGKTWVMLGERKFAAIGLFRISPADAVFGQPGMSEPSGRNA